MKNFKDSWKAKANAKSITSTNMVEYALLKVIKIGDRLPLEEKVRITVILLEKAFTPGRIGPRKYPYSALKEALRVAKLYTTHVYYHDNSFIISHLETEEETSDCEAIMNGVSTIFNERGWA